RLCLLSRSTATSSRPPSGTRQRQFTHESVFFGRVCPGDCFGQVPDRVSRLLLDVLPGMRERLAPWADSVGHSAIGDERGYGPGLQAFETPVPRSQDAARERRRAEGAEGAIHVGTVWSAEHSRRLYTIIK
ncbi:unnamed protein product, partial [Mycena citricolor]